MIRRVIRVGLEAFTRAFNTWRGLSQDPNDCPAEAYYAALYKHFLSQAIPDLMSGTRSLNVLDVGCGTGRFIIEFAKLGHKAIGIDYQDDALNLALAKARTAGVDVDLLAGDALTLLRRMEASSQDVVVSLEMLYVSPQFREIVAEMLRVLRPGGFIACSHRPKHYFITTLLHNGDISGALDIARTEEGVTSLKTFPVYYNWQSLAQMQGLYAEHGVHPVGVYPIGMFSGFGVDGTSAIANPERLTKAERSKLFELESQPLEDNTTTGRYTLIISRKPH